MKTLPPRDPNGKTGEQLRSASIERFKEAKTLSHHEHWLGALYLGGYAVEMMLKWALNDAAGDTRVPRRYTGKIWHNLVWILEGSNFQETIQNDAEAFECWSTIAIWTTDWRYETKLPKDFQKNAAKRAAEWLKSVEFLMKWLNVR